MKSTKSSISKKVAIALMILSFLLYGLTFILPFVPLSTVQKATAIPVLILFGEMAWWLGVAIVGNQLISKYRKYFNPCIWFSCKKSNL